MNRTTQTNKEHWERVWKGSAGRKRSTGHNIFVTIAKKIYRIIQPPYTPFNLFLKSWLSSNTSLKTLSVLEIGGTGTLGCLLAPVVDHYTLIDYSPEAIKQARNRLENIKNTKCIETDMFTYQPVDKYDLVISAGLIEHFFGSDREECFAAHAKLSSKYVCLAAPANIPINWWRHFRFYTTRVYPDQRPVSEKELFDLCLKNHINPLSMTR